ncbi:hypothetical protein BYT27DRAFT_7250482 [Phlegmacium glaucopus]|nr:hypothetical protein BYT27DRAFT_7250482 [Phlegmacium glaucopus]
MFLTGNRLSCEAKRNILLASTLLRLLALPTALVLPASNFFGRPPPLAPAPDLTVPEPTDSATAIIERFADAGFAVPEIIALLASHTIAAADKVDPVNNDKFYSTC